MKYVGIDIGGTSIKGGFVSENGEILNRFGFPIDKNASQEELIQRLGGLINEQIVKCDYKKSDFAGIGIGCPGSINSDTGTCDFSGNLNWHHLPIVKMIEEKTGMKARIANDANAAMAGEAKFGVGKNYHNLVLLTLGTGVGGGLYLNDHLYVGNEGKGAEMGHMIIAMNGLPCSCGLMGCLEAYASVTALIRQTKEAMEKNKNSLMWDYVAYDINKVDGKTAFECSKQGDKTALAVVDQYEDYLTVGCLNYCNIFRPDAIILGGGLSNQREYLTDAITKKLKKFNYGYESTSPVKVFVSALGNDAGILGAAALFID